jgi:GDP-L-fucose synthase
MADGFVENRYSLRGKKIFIAGHNGMVGAALARRLAGMECEILSVRREVLDLREQAATLGWISAQKPDVVVMAAARVGGILANQNFPADFIYDNLMIEANVIHASYLADVEKLLFLGSSCIYPAEAHQPILEEALLTGALAPTNEAYAVAKIAGIKMCQAYRAQHGCDFISAMPCNLYGPGDTFDMRRSHVIPALMLKAHAAVEGNVKTLGVWGTGAPRREFLHADDLADALVFLLENYSDAMPVNIGAGYDVSIAALTKAIAEVAGFRGRLTFDASKPDGVLRKLMDSSRIRKAGWQPQIDLKTGLTQTYAWYTNQQQAGKRDAA